MIKAKHILIAILTLGMSFFADTCHGQGTGDHSIGKEGLFIQRPEGKVYGTLLYPETDHQVPLVIFISGSGPTDRDGNSGEGYRNDALKKLAIEFANHEIASFRFDKKGVGASKEMSVNPEDIRMEHFVKDIAAWIVHFRADTRFDEIIILGHSLGSLLGIKASQMITTDGLVALAGPGVSLDSVIYRQLLQRSPFIARGAKPILDSLAMGEKVKDIHPLLHSIIPPAMQGYLISVFKEDPVMEIKKLDIPVLVAVGTHDVQASVEDAEALHAAATNSKLVIVEGMNHVLRNSPLEFEKNIKSYNQPELPINQTLVNSLVAFITEIKL